ERLVQLSELNIHLDLKVDHNFFVESSTLKKAIDQKIQTALKEAIRQRAEPQMSLQQYHFNIVFGFIKTGLVASQYSEEEWDNLTDIFYRELLVSDGKQSSQFIAMIHHPTTFFRLYDLLGKARIWEVLSKLLPEVKSKQWFLVIEALFETHKEKLQTTIFVEFLQKWVLQLFFQQKPMREFISELVRDKTTLEAIIADWEDHIDEFVLPIKLLDSIQFTKEEQRHNEAADLSRALENGLPVGQAGLILLAPFLPAFLRDIGFLNKDNRLQNALKLPIFLHYVATGETMAPEWKLTLPKVLSGLKPGQHCMTEILPTPEMDQLIDELLASVIEHWSKLGNTSSEGLKNTFLIREGELLMKNGFYYLNIKEKSFDILLSYIPWNYTTIKLDWMSTLMFVEWHK
ncbi:MAG: hypothetical protein KDD32_13535, partial [Bacteroidetes bacterium]|nr:hypothetical protein [Bacteroidota bacterium]